MGEELGLDWFFNELSIPSVPLYEGWKKAEVTDDNNIAFPDPESLRSMTDNEFVLWLDFSPKGKVRRRTRFFKQAEKQQRRFSNRCRRWVRTQKRYKEKLRREKLKRVNAP